MLFFLISRYTRTCRIRKNLTGYLERETKYRYIVEKKKKAQKDDVEKQDTATNRD